MGRSCDRAGGSALTFPARDPNRRLDAVFVSGGDMVRGCGVPPDLVEPGRGHRPPPVVADLVLPQN